MNPFHALQALLGHGSPQQHSQPVAQNNRAPLPASALQQLIRPTAQSNPSQVNVGQHQFNYATPDQQVPVGFPSKAPTVFKGMTFGNNRAVGQPVHDNNIYANTPDVTVQSPQGALGHTYTGHPLNSATLYTPQDVRPTLQQRMRLN